MSRRPRLGNSPVIRYLAPVLCGPNFESLTPSRKCARFFGSTLRIAKTTLGAMCLFSQPGLALSPGTSTTDIDFSRDVQPILRAHCFSCHGSEVQMSGLRLDSRATILKGGKSGNPA